MLFAAGLGLPVPEEIPIVTAGVLAHQEVARWWIALPVCLVGVLSGDVALYWAGRHWGEHIIEWRLVRLVLSSRREEALKAAYRRHGVKIVFTARHLAGFRAAAFLTAGIAHVPFGRFLLVDALAALITVPISFGLAFLFTDQLDAVLADYHRVERWAVLAAVVLAVGVFAVLAWRRGQRLARARTELAAPDERR